MAMSKIKALQIWCKRTLEGYRDVNITDMTTSWRNGLAFCAMIHKYRPDLIDYDSLDKENVYDNNKLAFDVAETELNIAALLEAADMVAMKVPDRLSVITYVAQYHNYFKDQPVLGGPGISVANKASGVKRHHEGSEPTSRPDVKRFTPSHENKQDKAQDKKKHQRMTSMGESCQICRNKVYLLERHIEDGKLYHRSCYRHSDLSPTSKVYARPSILSPTDDKKRRNGEEMEVNGMTALGKGFGAPSRVKSPERRAPKVSLNMDIDSSEPSKVTETDRSRSKLNGSHGKSEDNKTKSVIDKFERTEKSDWKSKRSESPKAEPRSYSSSAVRPTDLPKLNGHSESAMKDKWPPVKTDKSSSKSSEDVSVKSTPVPRPRQSLAKTEGLEQKSRSPENRMEVDDSPVKKSISSTSPTFKADEKQPQRPSPRKLPLVLQSQGKDSDSDTDSEESMSPKNKSLDSSDPSPKPRMFLKKNEKKIFGSTEKLNKTMAERIKDSKAKNTLRQNDEKSDKLSNEEVKTPSRLTTLSESPLSPPPLPRSTPPDIQRALPSAKSKSTTPPPRPSRMSPEPLMPVPKPQSGPPKPPRGHVKPGSPEPMEEGFIAKAKEWTRGEESVAVVVSPGSRSPEQAQEQVLGGLLKSLANVRHRQPEPNSTQQQITEHKSTTVLPSKSHASRSITTTTTTITTVTKNKTDTNLLSNNIKNNNNKTSKNSDDSVSQKYLSKNKLTQKQEPERIVDTTPIPAWQKEVARRKGDKDPKSKSRPKSSSTILDYHKGKGLHAPEISTTPTPSWQKDAKARKDRPARPARPKSMEVLSDGEGGFEIGEDNLRVLNLKKEKKPKENKKGKTSSKSPEESAPNLPKNAHKKLPEKTKHDKKDKNLSSQPIEESIPDWQKEAQKRMEARKGNFVDPEMKRVLPEKRVNGTDQKNETKLSNGMNSKDKNVKSNIPTGRNKVELNGDYKVDQSERNLVKKKYEGRGQKLLEDEHELDSVSRHKHDKQAVKDDNKTVPKTGRTKVSPGIKFNFDDNSSLEGSVELSPREERPKKGRQPPPRPRSPPPINRALKQSRISTPNKHTPPRIGISPNKLTPMQIQRQLMDIDSKLTDLELKGRRLEDSIRNAQEDEEDVLMIDWFLLVSEKNELVRQEADLIYASRENELEDEQDSVQDQLRQLLDKPNKTKEDKQEEEYLLGKLLDIVDQRSKIVDSIDDDKHRYEEEDREIAIVLEKKANRRSQERLL